MLSALMLPCQTVAPVMSNRKRLSLLSGRVVSARLSDFQHEEDVSEAPSGQGVHASSLKKSTPPTKKGFGTAHKSTAGELLATCHVASRPFAALPLGVQL
jgi:hypothetical protein